MKGYNIMYLGITPLSIGAALLDETGTGFVVCGICLLVIGLMQVGAAR